MRFLPLPFRAMATVLSVAHIKTAPHKKPMVTTSQAGALSVTSALSIAGCKSDQNDAAIITPAEKPMAILSIFWFTCLKNITVAEPKAVISQVPSVAKSAHITTIDTKSPLSSICVAPQGCNRYIRLRRVILFALQTVILRVKSE